MDSTVSGSPGVVRSTLLAKGHRLGVASVFLLLAACGLLSLLAPPDLSDAAGLLGMMVGYFAAGLTAIIKGRRIEGRERWAWLLIGSGLLSAGTGVASVGVTEAIGKEVPAFGPLDLFFIVAYALVLTGFGSLPHFSSTWAQRIRVLLDSVVGAVSIAAVMWVAVLDDLLTEFAQASAWDRWAGSAYPILDVVALIVVAIVTVRRSSYRFDMRLLLFALGIMAQSGADLTFLMSGVGKTFEQAEPIFALYVTAPALYLGSALLIARQPKARAYADRRGSLMAMLAPYSAAAVLVGLLVFYLEQSGISFNTRLVFVATLLVVGLVIVRQSVAIHENRMLVERQRRELVSSISHELRTPLTAIVGFLDVMAEDDAGLGETERKELTDLIHQEARHMSRIVADLVLLARGTPDQLTLKEEEITASEVVARAISSVENKTTEFTVDVQSDLRVRVDSGRVQQVLVNLITNAIRYGNGRGMVVIRPEGHDLAIEVHDNGPGVPKKFELTIWEQFERGPMRFNAAVPGSGIGLAVVDAITKAHDGTNDYRTSERLGGACFRIVLPHRVVAA